MMRRSSGSGSGSGVPAFVRSLLLLVLLTLGVPRALLAVARARFGGGSPLYGWSAPPDWSADRIEQTLTGPVADRAVADLVIRLSLVVAWCAVAVVLLTVVAEVVHMTRHAGLSMPDIRGLSAPQSMARVIASGLLVVMPLFVAASPTVARDGIQLVPLRRANSAIESGGAGWQPSDLRDGRDPIGSGRGDETEPTAARSPTGDAVLGESTPRSDRYTVRAGDSIYGIAERLAGPDARAVADFAQRMVELNLGNQMNDGRRFTNAAFIDVGWELALPRRGVDVHPASDEFGSHLVEPGESLWSIAEHELGDGSRWRAIFEANEGRVFDDGQRLVDPDLIRPGWRLDLATDEMAEMAEMAEFGEDDQIPVEVEAVEVEAVEVEAVDVVEVIGDDQSATSRPSVDLGTPELQTALPDNVWRSGPTPEPDLPVGDDDAPSDLAEPVARLAPHVVAQSERAQVTTTPPEDVLDSAQGPPVDTGTESDAAGLLDFGRAAMLAAGILSLLAVRRRGELRRARPRARLPERRPDRVETERRLRSIDSGDRFRRVDAAVRSLARVLVEQGERVMAVLVDAGGGLDLRVSGPVALPWPWTGEEDAWRLAAATPFEPLANDDGLIGTPCPTMVQLGRDDLGRDVYIDLEAWEAIRVAGPDDQADAIVAAVAATLAGSEPAEVATLIGVGIPDAAFLGHRLHLCVPDGAAAVDAARLAVGTTISERRSTFELRTRAVSSEAWEPAVVLAGSAAGEMVLPRQRTGMAVFSAAPIVGPASRLVSVGDVWEFEPLGLQMSPVGLSVADIVSLADLVDMDDAVAQEMTVYRPAGDDNLDDSEDLQDTSADALGAGHPLPTASGDDVTGFIAHSDEEAPSSESWPLMVRLLGPVEVVSPAGESISFERSKARELVAWLATHRRRSTRTAARTALWEIDVRDATFANVVSEARRSLARLVTPPEGEEWVGRTMTEALPLHDRICTDAEVLERALEAARSQPTTQAITTLVPAVELIAGLPFEGTSYLWPDPEGITSNLVLLATSATSELAARCLEVGDVAGVFRATGRGLQVLPGHEELIGLRMEAHARVGDHAGVRHEWESYLRVITADPWSDGEPSPKLAELRRELLSPSLPQVARSDDTTI